MSEKIIMETSLGNIHLELNNEKAPITVENFLQYVDDGFFNGLIFHRVIADFMIQGGGFDKNMDQKQTRKPIQNEAKNGLKNLRGSIAMARTSDINSATAQFFINLKDNSFLDHGTRDYGYAVFGKVVQGIDVMDKIAAVKTGRKNGMSDVPVETVQIISIKRAVPVKKN